MANAQHAPLYRAVPSQLRAMRVAAEPSQRELAAKLRRPQSWVYNCETANRRVDIAEFIRWCRVCRVDRLEAMGQLLGRIR